jgi:NAD(P)-dependent dehydrogenase (short-subunit alcohol dehydrogenase family)
MTTHRSYLVTGGTSGIGRFVAQHLTELGHRVWITGTREETLSSALGDGVAMGGSVCDISSTEEVSRAFAEATADGGLLDGVFANAGIDGQGVDAIDIDPDNFLRVLDVNVVGTLRASQAAFHHLKRPGALVIKASVNWIRPEKHFLDYNTSKSSALAIARSLALDWADSGITVTSISPGYFRTNMTSAWIDDPESRQQLLARIPMHRFGEPVEIARLVEFLLENSIPFLNGTDIPIAGTANV